MGKKDVYKRKKGSVLFFLNVKARFGAVRTAHPKLTPGFCNMKHLGVLLLPREWDARPSPQGYPHSGVIRHTHPNLINRRFQ